MPTLLEACNEVLLMVGEREVPNFSSPVGKKVRLSLRRAQFFVGTLHPWRHLRAKTTPSLADWVGDVVTLAPFSVIYSSHHAPLPSQSYEVQQINPETLQYKARNAPIVGIPQYYSVVGENKVQVYPQPTDTMKAQMTFSLLTKAQIASAPTDVLQGPDGYNELIVLYAQIVMHRCHTTDLNAAESTAREFETSIHMYRSLDVAQQVSYM
jgi:hypothetical protein